MTITGIRGKSHNSEPLKVQEKETSHVRRTKFKPHDVGLQVSHHMDTEVSQKECKVLEGHLMHDHVHILLSIPPKYLVSQVVGYIKGKSAIQIARNFQGRKKNFVGQHFWARGYYVSTVGKDEDAVREYIQRQEKEDKRFEQLKLF